MIYLSNSMLNHFQRKLFRRKKPSVFTIAFTIIWHSALAMTQHPEINQPDSLRKIPTSSEILLPEVLIEAYNHTGTLSTIPGSLSVRSKTDISNASYPSLLPLLNTIPGVLVHHGTFNTNRIVIRGIGARVPFTTGRIRAYFDEVPLTNGSGFSLAEYIDPVFADQVQVIKSPASGAYGSGLGGTLRIRSKSAEEYKPSLLAEVQAGAFEMINATLALEEKRGRHSLRIAYGRGSMEGYRQNNRMQRQTTGIIWHFAPSAKHQLHMKLIANETKAQIPSSIDSLTFHTTPRSAAPSWLKTKGYEKGRRILGALGHTYLRGEAKLFKTSLFFNISGESEVRPFDMFDEKRRLAGIKSTLNHRFTNGPLLVDGSTGIEAFAEKVNFNNLQNINGEGTPGNPISNNEELINAIAFFAQLNASIGAKQLNAGLSVQQTAVDFENFSHISQKRLQGTYKTGWIVSPRIGINHSFSDRNNIYLSVNHGYSPPALTETLNTDGTINPAIKPEKSLTWDAGWRGSLKDSRAWFDVAAYYMHITDLLVAERIGDDAWIGRNAGKARHYGLEAELKTVLYGLRAPASTSPLPIHQVQFHLNAQAGRYIFTEYIDRGIDRSGKQIPGIPQVSMNLMLQIQAYRGLFFNPSVFYSGRMPLNDGNTGFSEPFTLVNLRTGLKKTVKKTIAEIYLQANNLTSRHYASMILVNAPGLRNQRYYYPGLPLHFYGGIIIRFNYRPLA